MTGQQQKKQSNENDTVNINCDSSDYLIVVNETNRNEVAVVMADEMQKRVQKGVTAAKEDDRCLLHKAEIADQILASKNGTQILQTPRRSADRHQQQDSNETMYSEDGKKSAPSSVLGDGKTKTLNSLPAVTTSSFITFDELVRLCALQVSRLSPVSTAVRLRLCGGGEESINNGTSAWGTPGVTNNPAGSSWGAINSQQTANASAVGSSTSSSSGSGAAVGSTQQQSQATAGTGSSAWGGAGAGGPSSNVSGGGAGGTGGSGGGQQPPKGPNGGMEGGGNAWNGSGAGGTSMAVGSAQSNASASGGPASATNSANLEQQQQQQQQGGGPAAQQPPTNAQQQQVEGLAPVVPVAAGGVGGAAVQSSTAKNQLEQLNSLREALFAQDGWGSENVDQDTQWDVPASPEPGGKTDPNSATSGPMAGIPMWKTNTGTELWEANLRNGGQLPQQQPPVSKTWGPQNNYGGTWGEDDEGNEPGSVWNGAGGGAGGNAGPMGPGGAVGVAGLRDQVAGVAGMMGGPQQQQQQQQQPQSQPPWNSGVGAGALGGTGGPGVGGMWGGGPGVANVGAGAGGGVVGLKKDGNDWGAVATAAGAGAGASGWSGEGRGVGNPAAVAASVAAVGGAASGGGLDASGIDMRNMRIASAMDSNREIRGDPRGISGRLNGNVGLWDQHQMSAMQPKMPPTVTTPGTAGPGGNGGAQWPGGPNNNPLAAANNGAGGGGVGKIGSSGWDDLSGGGNGGPPGVRRNMDDGTALWGQNALNRQNSANAVVSGGGGGWKDGSGNDGGMGRSAGMHRNAMMGGGLVGRMGGGAAAGGPVGGGPMKPDNLWGQNPNRGVGNWGAGGGPDDPSNTGNWDDKSGGVGGIGSGSGGGMGANSLWNDGASIAGVAGGGGNGGGGWNKSKGGSGWNDTSGVPGGAGTMDISEWGMPPNKPPSKMELLRCSKQYRALCEHGFKKEDVENVLRMTNMNMEESLELLNRNSAGGAGINDWRRSDNHGSGAFGDQFIGSGAGGGGGGGGVSGRFAAAAAGIGPMAFQNNQNNLGGGGGVFGGGNGPGAGSGSSFNSMKFGAGASGPGGNGPPGAFGQPLGSSGGSVAGGLNQPNAQSQQISNHQLRVLVQQIQLAVQNGYLDHQILNQPLAPQTLMLLNQLLNHIKQLHLMQNNLARTGGGGVNAVQMSLAINKLKSQITSLQSQIATQQSIYLKQHQQQQPHQQQQQTGHPGAVNNVNVAALAAASGGHPGNDLFRSAGDMSGLPGAFGDLALKDNGPPFPSSTGSTSQQSRLNQWKLPAATTPTTPGGLDKDVSDLNDFVRAPGATSKSSGPSGSSGIDDSPWSNGRSNLTDSGWPDSNVQDNKDWPGGNDAFSDLVPEFEPGKPWKGTQATRIEDDPTITPGSVARNSLSIAAAKESNLFGGTSGGAASSSVSNVNSKSSPTESTWSFNPSGTSGSGGGGGGAGGMQNSGHYGGSNPKVPKNPWQDSGTPTMQPSDLAWDTGLGGGKARAGTMMGGGALGKQGGGKLVEANGWNTSTSAQGGSSWNSGTNSSWASTWILLRNLTAQIDGSTLRTLCMQHGPLLNFQPYTHHSVALCKYATREEAQKAQQALNNCPLGNTTICAEIPTESDVQYILSQLGGSMNASNGMTNGLTGAASGGGQNWRLVAAQQSQPSVSRSNSVVADAWSSSAWGSGNAGPSLWPTMDGGPADRGTPANLNSLLPESLLGSELN
ncbi:protein Gawky-like [Anopheles albimanus]|uniref:Uncharacterized protein n=1 Tax=Anopheles albimanus TaxID=7167 RepID=A0A182F534_ANOAL|nr:protein Gawky-like [Anopheles albimanus]XP_035795529.1 protein Gawky-like [Anopheles albimanus]XP_035795530.1 protein Gawky-like [Anopheles albimanus]XP_035795531.1 protein Gawky-like [Anopheles albimanus]